MAEKEKRGAWDFALGLIKVDNLEPSKDFMELVEKEIRGEISTVDIKVYLDKKYTALGIAQNA